MRRTALITIVVAAVLSTGPVALAGGSVIELIQLEGVGGAGPGGPWAAPGAVVTMTGGFCTGSQPHPSTEPWHAYLARDGQPDRYLAPVTISTSGTGACSFLATVTFSVPDIASGDAWIEVCDLGCHHGTGDLVGGSLAIAGSSQEALLAHRLQVAMLRIDRVERQASSSERDAVRLEDRIAELEASMVELDAMLERARSQRDVALEGRDAAEADVHAGEMESRNWRYAAYVLALLTVATWMIGWARRRDTVRIKIPDTIEELDQAENDPADH